MYMSLIETLPPAPALTQAAIGTGRTRQGHLLAADALAARVGSLRDPFLRDGLE